MFTCPECGYETEDQWSYCPECGSEVWLPDEDEDAEK